MATITTTSLLDHESFAFPPRAAISTRNYDPGRPVGVFASLTYGIVINLALIRLSSFREPHCDHCVRERRYKQRGKVTVHGHGGSSAVTRANLRDHAPGGFQCIAEGARAAGALRGRRHVRRN